MSLYTIHPQILANGREGEVKKGKKTISKLIATERKTGKIVAVKTVGKIDNVIQKYSIATQISILRKTSNEHIIKLKDAFEFNDSYYIVTELAPNGDLWAFLNKRGKLSEWSTAWIAKQILLALNHLHSAMHVVHW